MLLDVTNILKNNGSYIDIDFNEKIDSLISFSDEYEFDKPVKFQGRLTSNKEVLELKGQLGIEYATKCARCLAPVEDVLNIGVFEEIVSESDDKEEFTYKDNTVNLDKILTDDIILNLPAVKLCRKDCKGLCPRCGKNLNESSCECVNDDKDPRFDVLKKLLK